MQIGGVLYEKGTEPTRGHMVQPDIAPYKSMITGEMITSRSQHREHLRKHNCVEVGNDVGDLTYKGIPDVAPQQRLESLRAQIDRMPHKEFRSMLKRDAEYIKWNSRK